MRTGKMGKLLSLDARGEFGYSGGFGRLCFGHNRLGFYHWMCGIYQKHYYYGRAYISRMRFYRPTNPRSELQQAWRAVVASGWQEWATFDQETKEQWRLRARNRRITGANMFMSEWLKAHKQEVLG